MKHTALLSLVALAVGLLPEIGKARSATIQFHGKSAIATAQPTLNCPGGTQGIEILADETSADSIWISSEFDAIFEPAVPVRRGLTVSKRDKSSRTYYQPAKNSHLQKDSPHAVLSTTLYGCVGKNSITITGGHLKVEGQLLDYGLNLKETFVDLADHHNAGVRITHTINVFERGPLAPHLKSVQPENSNLKKSLGGINLIIENLRQEFDSPKDGQRPLEATLSFYVSFAIRDEREDASLPSN